MAGVIVHLGGQTPLRLARGLAAAGVPVAGTSPDAIHLAEDRGEFGAVLAAAGLTAPRHGTATSFTQAKAVAEEKLFKTEIPVLTGSVMLAESVRIATHQYATDSWRGHDLRAR